MILLGCILSVCSFTGCEPKDSTDAGSTSPTNSISESEKNENKETSIQKGQTGSAEEEIVEEEVKEFVVDENAGGEQNGYSEEVVIP